MKTIKKKFTTETINSMRNMINNTNVSELGCALCEKNNGDIVIGAIVSGNKFDLKFDPKTVNCKSNEKMVGLFHTHPKQPSLENLIRTKSSKPNIEDLTNAYVTGFACIGSQPNKITCLYRKTDNITNEDIIQVEQNINEFRRNVNSYGNMFNSKKINKEQFSNMLTDEHKKRTKQLINKFSVFNL